MSLEIKKKIIATLIDDLDRDLALLKRSAASAREAATHEESKAEDKYDTRGLEASYLAAGQAKRAGEIVGFIETLKLQGVTLVERDTPVQLTSLVHIEGDEGSSWVLVLPQGGGRKVNVLGREVQVVTPDSPLGAELVGKILGDEIQLIAAKKKREYTIVAHE